MNTESRSEKTVPKPADKPIRVLNLLRWLTATGGGIRTYVAAMAVALEQSNIQLSGGAVEPGHPPDCIEALHLGHSGSTGVALAWQYFRWARTAVPKADVVYIHGVYGWSFMIGAPLCLMHRIPFVVCPHAEFEPWYQSGKWLKKKLYLWIVALPMLRRSAAVIATTQVTGRLFRGIDSELPVVVAKPGVSVPDTPTVYFLDDQRPVSQALRVLYLGRIDLVKNVPLLVLAVARLRDSGIDAVLDIAGSGSAACVGAVQDAIRETRLESVVKLHGYVDGVEKIELMRRSHVMAVPSYAENFSFATAEALAIGLPAVVTSGVALADDVAHNDCGSVIPPGEVLALTAALAEYGDPQTLRRRALNAHRFALTELSLGAMGKTLDAVFRAAASSRGQQA